MTSEQLIKLQEKVVRNHDRAVQIFKEQRVAYDNQTLAASRILFEQNDRFGYDILASASFKVRTEALSIPINTSTESFMNAHDAGVFLVYHEEVEHVVLYLPELIEEMREREFFYVAALLTLQANRLAARHAEVLGLEEQLKLEVK